MHRLHAGGGPRAALRQVGAGNRAFAAENRMRLPGNPSVANGSVVGWNEQPNTWPSRILPFIGDPKVFVSPGVEKVRVPQWPRYDDQLTPALLGCSYCLNGQASWRPIFTIPQPSQMVVLWVLGATTIAASRYPNTLSGNDWTAVDPTQSTNLPYGGILNWLFVDGHVESGHPRDYYVPEKFGQGQFWDWRDARDQGMP